MVKRSRSLPRALEDTSAKAYAYCIRFLCVVHKKNHKRCEQGPFVIEIFALERDTLQQNRKLDFQIFKIPSVPIDIMPTMKTGNNMEWSSPSPLNIGYCVMLKLI